MYEPEMEQEYPETKVVEAQSEDASEATVEYVAPEEEVSYDIPREVDEIKKEPVEIDEEFEEEFVKEVEPPKEDDMEESAPETSEQEEPVYVMPVESVDEREKENGVHSEILEEQQIRPPMEFMKEISPIDTEEASEVEEPAFEL